jgi:hypothetical protein
MQRKATFAAAESTAQQGRLNGQSKQISKLRNRGENHIMYYRRVNLKQNRVHIFLYAWTRGIERA